MRFYSFKDAASSQPNLADTATSMTFRPDKGAALTTEIGRVAGRTAVVLDGNCFEAPALPLPDNAFTVPCGSARSAQASRPATAAALTA